MALSKFDQILNGYVMAKENTKKLTSIYRHKKIHHLLDWRMSNQKVGKVTDDYIYDTFELFTQSRTQIIVNLVTMSAKTEITSDALPARIMMPGKVKPFESFGKATFVRDEPKKETVSEDWRPLLMFETRSWSKKRARPNHRRTYSHFGGKVGKVKLAKYVDIDHTKHHKKEYLLSVYCKENLIRKSMFKVFPNIEVLIIRTTYLDDAYNYCYISFMELLREIKDLSFTKIIITAERLGNLFSKRDYGSWISVIWPEYEKKLVKEYQYQGMKIHKARTKRNARGYNEDSIIIERGKRIPKNISSESKKNEATAIYAAYKRKYGKPNKVQV